MHRESGVVGYGHKFHDSCDTYWPMFRERNDSDICECHTELYLSVLA